MSCGPLDSKRSRSGRRACAPCMIPARVLLAWACMLAILVASPFSCRVLGATLPAAAEPSTTGLPLCAPFHGPEATVAQSCAVQGPKASGLLGLGGPVNVRGVMSGDIGSGATASWIRPVPALLGSGQALVVPRGALFRAVKQPAAPLMTGTLLLDLALIGPFGSSVRPQIPVWLQRAGPKLSPASGRSMWPQGGPCLWQ
jgi:hypothetical protein